MNTTEEVKEILKKLPLTPTGVEKWVHERVIANTYIIFDSKRQKAVCTRCGKEFSTKYIGDAKHDGWTHCPKCGATATYKANRYGRKKLTEYFRILILTHRGKTVYGTLFEVTAEFEPFGKPALSKWLSALYVFNENERHYYKHHPGWTFSGEYWQEVKRINMPVPPRGMWYSPAKFERTEIYTANLENVFRKSCLRYHYDEYMFYNLEMTPVEMIRYIDLSLKYPAIELLRKAGYETLVMGYLDGNRGKNAINIRGKNLKSILRLPKRWHKKVRELEMRLWELQIFQRISEAEKAVITPEMFRDLDIGSVREEIELFVPMEKAMKYITEQGENLRLYRDYLVIANRNGAELNRNRVLFPQNLLAAHDQMTEIYKTQKDMNLTKAIIKRAEKLKAEFPMFESKGLLIRVAESQAELNKESRVLAHCVKTYAERVADGRSNIFFIRKTDAPDQPYYTLELSPKKELVQCRGNHNCGMTEEVKVFVDSWLEYIKKPQKKKKEAA